MVADLPSAAGARRSHDRTAARFAGALLVLVLAAFPAARGWASVDVSAICERAARIGAQRTGVPLSVLRTISLAETGRKSGGAFRPWPWTVNMEGRGVWFDTRQEALDFVRQNFRRGARSFDVGCFQLNYRWHGQAFGSVEQMFDPAAGAIYAANFLKQLFAEKGNWVDAAGAYHSRTPEFANRYKARFARLLAKNGNQDGAVPAVLAMGASAEPVPAVPPARIRLNNFPLLRGATSGPASLGSLMPATAGAGARRFIGGG